MTRRLSNDEEEGVSDEEEEKESDNNKGGRSVNDDDMEVEVARKRPLVQGAPIQPSIPPQQIVDDVDVWIRLCVILLLVYLSGLDFDILFPVSCPQVSSPKMPSSFDDAILAHRNPSGPIGPFDDLVAAYMCFEGAHILCTSPNQTHIPLPILGEEDVRLRANLRYGTADHTLWPQFVIPNTSHFAVMPREPVASDDSLAPIWWDPTPDDFVPSYRGIITGIGSVHKRQLNLLQRVEAEMQKRVDRYLNASPKPTDNATQQISLQRYHMENSYIRLCSLKTSYVETVFTVTEFQRYCLEILGFLNFMEIYRPRLAGSQLGSNKADHVMGCFTWDSRAAQELFKAGVPVWFLRRWQGNVYPYDNNILKIVDFTQPHPSILKECAIVALPTLFRGHMTDEGRYNAIWNRSMARLNPEDPFRGETRTASPTTSQSQTPSSLSRASPRPYPAPANRKGGSNAHTAGASRNKFQPLSYPAAPFSIPAWREGLASVDSSPVNIIDKAEVGNTAGHYVVPDPGVLVGPQNDEKRAQYFTTWLRCCDNWLRVTEDGGLAQSNQSWRDILGLDFNAEIVYDAYNTIIVV
ncbi:hypothetical protein BJ165DRAFT_1408565 [Panaeolus papilionaceus]|nr:hypothetical protein BJ165DRAFT_1408565 [Panaeolus papilionaceus]